MLIYEYYNAELLQNIALKIADTVGLLTPPAGQAFGVLSALTNLETVSSTLIENYSAVQVHTLGVSVPTEDAVQAYVQDIIEHDVPSIDKIIVKSATIPTASADLLGAVYQYVGQTDSTYEHGYIYECVAETTTETLIMFDPVGTGKLGFDYQNHSVYELFDRIAALTTPTFDPQDVVSGSFRLDKANELWYISGYDANGNALFTDFTVEATGGEYCLDGYGYIYTFLFPDDYEDGHTENFTIVQDQQSVYSWERIDVQPNSEAAIAELQAEVDEIQSVIPAQASASNQLADKAYVQTGLDGKQDNLTATDGLTLNNNVISGKTLQDDIADINALIPNQATAQNQLADQAFVNSSIETNTATFRGTYNTLAELESQTADNNDYGFVVSIDAAGNTVYSRYKYNGTAWVFEYALNNSSFTASQWAAINSNATDTKIAQIDTNKNTINNHIANVSNPHQVTKAQVGLSNVDNTADLDKPISTATQNALNAKTDATNRINGAPLSNAVSNFFGVSNTAAATVQKEVSIPSITTLDVGTTIIVKPTVTSTVANSTLKLNDFDAYPMRYNNAAITTSTNRVVWGANIPSLWVFDGTHWVFSGHGLDSNTTYTINYTLDAGRYKAGTGTYAVTRYSLLMEKADGTWEKITNTASNYSTGTSKTVNTNGFQLDHIRYYNTTAVVANGALIATNTLQNKAASVVFAYSANCGTAPGWAVGNYIYLVGSMGADGLFYLDSTQWWANALPNTNDGKLYIRLGIALTTTDSTMSFFEDRPIYYHDGTGIKEYKVADNKQDVISDLATIRTGAAAGATAVQPGDLATVATSGSYNDLSNKPTIPAAQVNSDWNATGGVAQILNKPTLGTMAAESASDYTKTSGFATVATSGSYNDLLNKPTIPAAQVNADWDANSGVAQILNKPTLGTAASANATDFATAAQGALATSAVQPRDLATVATTGSYNDLSNTPTIPTVNNPTITFTQGGVNKGSITLNQSTSDTIALDAGSSTLSGLSDVTITSATSGQVLKYDGSKWVNGAGGGATVTYDSATETLTIS